VINTPNPAEPNREKIEILGRLTEIFPGVTEERLSEAAAEISEQDVQEGQVLIQEGTKPRGIFMVLQGRFGIFTQDSNSHIARVRVVTAPGALLGEQSIRVGRRFANATVISLTQGLVGFIPEACFRVLLALDADAAARLAEAGRVQALVSRSLKTTHHVYG